MAPVLSIRIATLVFQMLSVGFNYLCVIWYITISVILYSEKLVTFMSEIIEKSYELHITFLPLLLCAACLASN